MTELVRVDGQYEITPHKVVWKYPLDLSPDPQVREIPRGARFLHGEFIQADAVPSQHGRFDLWYEVELKERGINISHVFQVMGTGVELPKAVKHLVTGCERDYSWVVPKIINVWHLYEWPSGSKVVDV